MYILNRRGKFSATETLNQCKDIEHPLYFYHLKVVTKGLDNDGFVIDHEDINKAIISNEMYGSCEEMAKRLFKIVKKLMKGQKFVAFWCAVYASEEPEHLKSFMEFKWYNKKYGPKMLNYL